MGSLSGKVVIVTGAGRGIGKGIALKFAQEGSKVVVVDINEEAAKQTVEEIKSCQGEGLALKADVASEDSVRDMMERVKKEYAVIDVLVNNAGIQPQKKPFYQITVDEWDRTLSVNLKSVYICSKIVTPIFIDQGFGNIVNTASVAGPIVWEGSADYIASKGAIRDLTRAMALELATYGIRVNSVAPGHVDTEINRELLSTPGAREEVCSTVPLRRMALPEDLAGAYAFLASDEAKYITGHVLYVDGGLSQIK